LVGTAALVRVFLKFCVAERGFYVGERGFSLGALCAFEAWQRFQRRKFFSRWRLTPKSGEVQEADDEEWGSATATGGETGECKKAIERGVEPPEQPAQLQWLRSPAHSPRFPHTLANALAPSAFAQPMYWGRGWSIRRSRGAARTGRVGYARSPYRAEPNPLGLFTVN
jgi:hypothetical protein